MGIGGKAAGWGEACRTCRAAGIALLLPSRPRSQARDGELSVRLLRRVRPCGRAALRLPRDAWNVGDWHDTGVDDRHTGGGRCSSPTTIIRDPRRGLRGAGTKHAVSDPDLLYLFR